jgi:hypothetical protein
MSKATASAAGATAPVLDDEGNEIPRAMLLAAMKLIKKGMQSEGASSTDEGWEAVAGPSTMTDASKRRASAGHFPRGRKVSEGPMSSPAAEATLPEATMPEPTMGGQIRFPSGITSMKQWGDTLLDFGKFKGTAYDDLILRTDPEAQSYIKWCLGRQTTPSSSELLKDFANFIASYKLLGEAGTAGSVSMYPGTTQRRVFKENKAK